MDFIRSILSYFHLFFSIVLPVVVILMNRREPHEKRRFTLLVLSLLFVSGCWDEEQYKDVTIVPLIGLEAEGEG